MDKAMPVQRTRPDKKHPDTTYICTLKMNTSQIAKNQKSAQNHF